MPSNVLWRADICVNLAMRICDPTISQMVVEDVASMLMRLSSEELTRFQQAVNARNESVQQAVNARNEPVHRNASTLEISMMKPMWDFLYEDD